MKLLEYMRSEVGVDAGWTLALLAGLLSFVVLTRPLEPFGTFIELDSTTSVPPIKDAIRADGASARVMIVGDLMQHRLQAGSNFVSSYAPVKPLLESADLAIGNLEFPVDPSLPVGPPVMSVKFNGSPAHLDAIQYAGFDILSFSNNHSFDRDVSGLQATLDELTKRGIRFVGAAHTLDELHRQVVIADLAGIRVGVLAYTYGVNTYDNDDDMKQDIPPRDLPVAMSVFQDWTAEYRQAGQAQFANDVARLRAAGAEFVIALPHWGEEWKVDPTNDQRLAASDMIAAGIDLVAGSHSHVLGPVERVGEGWVAYGLSSFVSDFRQLETRTAGVLVVDLARRKDGTVHVANLSFVPTLVRSGHVVDVVQPDGPSEHADAWRWAQGILGAMVVRADALPSIVR